MSAQKTDIEKLVTIRTLQRDMLFFAADKYLEALDLGKDMERATLNLRLATQKVDAELL